MPEILEMRNFSIHAKTTQAQSPVIVMTLQMTLTYVVESFEVMFVSGETCK